MTERRDLEEKGERESERERYSTDTGLLEATDHLQHPCLPIDIRGVCRFGTCSYNKINNIPR